MTLQILGAGFLILLLVVAAAAALYASVKAPKSVKIVRSLLILATPEVLFPYINNSRRIQEWNPFIDTDPSTKLVYTGPTEGVGAQWDWEGARAGAGHATITESIPNQRVALRLDFRKPFKVTNCGEYSLAPAPSGSQVTWMIDESALIPCVLSLFMNLDRMVGSQFERGLRKLKALAEAK